MKMVWVSLIGVFLLGCGGGKKGPQDLQGKWYQTQNVCLEFRQDGRFAITDSLDRRNIIHREGKFGVSKKNIELTYTDPDFIAKGQFTIKDSVLLMVYSPVTKTGKKDTPSSDSVYYHKNPYYTTYESEQLFKYGKIIDKDRREPLPFIYFEF